MIRFCLNEYWDTISKRGIAYWLCLEFIVSKIEKNIKSNALYVNVFDFFCLYTFSFRSRAPPNKTNLKKLGLDYTVNRAGSLVCLFFTSGPVQNFDDATKSDIDKFNAYFKEMIDRGILIAPSQYEAMFLSYAHTDEDIEYTIKCNYEALKASHNL